jgi:hypothetical protein
MITVRVRRLAEAGGGERHAKAGCAVKHDLGAPSPRAEGDGDLSPSGRGHALRHPAPRTGGSLPSGSEVSSSPMAVSPQDDLSDHICRSPKTETPTPDSNPEAESVTSGMGARRTSPRGDIRPWRSSSANTTKSSSAPSERSCQVHASTTEGASCGERGRRDKEAAVASRLWSGRPRAVPSKRDPTTGTSGVGIRPKGALHA